MNIKIIRLNRGGYGPKGWSPAFLIANMDGHRVRCTGNGKGWDCACGNEDCDHLNAVAELIDPAVLEELELDSDRHLRGPRSHFSQARAQRRKRVPR